MVDVRGDRGDLSRTVCLSGPTQEKQSDTHQYSSSEAAILIRQAIAGNNQPIISPQLSRPGSVLLLGGAGVSGPGASRALGESHPRIKVHYH
jgi:hypothetical protein